MSRRSLSRQSAVQVLFQDDFNPDRSRDPDRRYLIEQLEDDQDLIDLAWWMIDGTRDQQQKIDLLVSNSADNWEIGRISAVDRNIIRLAVFEAKFGKTPAAVAIDEAIRLAKRYGGKESPRFVNGVLDRVLKFEGEAVQKERSTDSDSKIKEAGPGLRRFIGSSAKSVEPKSVQPSPDASPSLASSSGESPLLDGQPGESTVVQADASDN